MMTCEGFEPPTPSLSRKCSPTELTGRIAIEHIFNYIDEHTRCQQLFLKNRCS